MEDPDLKPVPAIDREDEEADDVGLPPVTVRVNAIDGVATWTGEKHPVVTIRCPDEGDFQPWRVPTAAFGLPSGVLRPGDSMTVRGTLLDRHPGHLPGDAFVRLTGQVWDDDSAWPDGILALCWEHYFDENFEDGSSNSLWLPERSFSGRSGT